MKKKNVWIRMTCLVVFCAVMVSGTCLDAKTPEIVESQEKALVAVFVHDRNGRRIVSGSGFIVDREGVVATSCNLITKFLESQENTMAVELADGTSLPMKQLLSNDCRNGLVLITIQGSELPSVTLAKGYKPKEGEEVVVMGRTSGGKRTSSEGRIKSVQKRDDIFQVTVPVTSRGDGSPVFNRKGEVIGLSTLIHGKKEAQHIVFSSRYVSKEFALYGDLAKELSVLPPVEPLKKREEPPPPLPDARFSDKAEQEFLRGVSYEKSGMYDEAIAAYARALGINANYGDAYLNLGLVYYRLGKYSKAVDAYRNALRINPANPSVYNKLGAAYVILGEYPLALDAFKHSITIDPKNSDTHFNLGVACILAGDKNGALEQYIVLKELDTHQAEKLLNLMP
jgi:Flp pilus assembly protein TadD